MARILLVDDHLVILDGLKHLLEKSGHIVVGTATKMTRVSSMINKRGSEAEVLILDLQLPDGNGVELCQEIRNIYPDLKIIALTMLDDPHTAYSFLKKGGNGFISKTEDFNQILKAIQVVQSGQVYLSDTLKPLVLNQLSEPRQPQGKRQLGILTKREKEVLALIKEEMTIPQISDRLQIAESTVISHRKALLSKLHAKNTAGLINAIYKYKLLD